MEVYLTKAIRCLEPWFKPTVMNFLLDKDGKEVRRNVLVNLDAKRLADSKTTSTTQNENHPLPCGLSIPLAAQTTLRTFTSPDGIFQFKYSDVLVDCMSAGKQENGTGSSVPESCMSQGAICDGPGSEGSAMACFAYPKERFKDKPLFLAATFFVSEIRSAKTEKECLKGSPNWLAMNSRAGTTTINHVAFKTFEIGDNWTSGGQDGPAYRIFTTECVMSWASKLSLHGQSMIRELSSKFTKKDWSEVEGRLGRALNSFVFLK